MEEELIALKETGDESGEETKHQTTSIEKPAQEMDEQTALGKEDSMPPQSQSELPASEAGKASYHAC